MPQQNPYSGRITNGEYSFYCRRNAHPLIENEQGMREIVNHLIDVHGFRKIAIIKWPETNPEARLRYKAYKHVLAKHNIPIDPELVLPGDFRYESGREAVRILLDQRKRNDVEAIVLSNDDMAIIACDTLNKRGMRIPQDIAVTGFDDIEDALTGIYNRRGFFILGEQYFKIATRTNSNFLVIFADLDGLKKIG